MYDIKLISTILFLSGTFSTWLYALMLLIKYLKGQLTRNSIIKKTFGITFRGWMLIFAAYSVWLDGWNLNSAIFFISIALVFSFLGAFAFTASFLVRKK